MSLVRRPFPGREMARAGPEQGPKTEGPPPSGGRDGRSQLRQRLWTSPRLVSGGFSNPCMKPVAVAKQACSHLCRRFHRIHRSLGAGESVCASRCARWCRSTCLPRLPGRGVRLRRRNAPKGLYLSNSNSRRLSSGASSSRKSPMIHFPAQPGLPPCCSANTCGCVCSALSSHHLWLVRY